MTWHSKIPYTFWLLKWIFSFLIFLFLRHSIPFFGDNIRCLDLKFLKYPKTIFARKINLIIIIIIFTTEKGENKSKWHGGQPLSWLSTIMVHSRVIQSLLYFYLFFIFTTKSRLKKGVVVRLNSSWRKSYIIMLHIYCLTFWSNIHESRLICRISFL